MLENSIAKDSLFLELQEFASALGLVVVDVSKSVRSTSDVHVSITIARKGSDVNIDDCENFHRAVQPFLELKLGRDALSMEVSTDGIQRNIKDFHEFEIFEGRYCRIYSSKYSSWVEGTITNPGEKSLVLSDYLITDSGIGGELLEMGFDEIQKAKLDFKWEGPEEKKVKNALKQKEDRKKLKVEKTSGEDK